MQTWRGDLATTHAPRSVPRGFDSSGFTFIPILTAFAGVALRRYRIRPAASMLGFAFSAVFVAAEMSVRSIDLFLVSRNWAVAYRSATSETVKQAIAARIEIWDLSVAGLYFGLLGVHMLSSICFTPP